MVAKGRRAGRPRLASIDEALVRATLHVVAQEGLGSASLEKIAAKAGITRPAIYRRYRTKEDLALHCLAHLALAFPTNVRGTAREQLSSYEVWLTDALGDPIRLAWLGSSVAARRANPRLYRACLDHLLESPLARAQELVHVRSPERRRYAAQALVGGCLLAALLKSPRRGSPSTGVS